jgi:hypothetical protein
MGLYGRNDVMSVAVPTTAGGCGAMHSRPVADGVPVDEWDIEEICVVCAVSLRGDPLWAAMPSEIPETPDEKIVREDAEKRGERAIKKSQEKLSVQQGELNQRIVELLERGGTNGAPDPVVIAALVQQEIAKVLAARGIDVSNSVPVPAPPGELTEEVPVDGGVDLMRLHVRTLGKMCRERGLDGRGSKVDLVARLTEPSD